MASLIQQPPLAFERVAEMLLAAVVLALVATLVVALLRSGWAGGTRRMRRRRSPIASDESLFVARTAPSGPELYVVGEGVRRLAPARREADGTGFDLAARVLSEVMGRPPSREQTWAFVEDGLGHLPADGFVLPVADVFRWVDAQGAGRPTLAGRAAQAGIARGASIASGLRAARSSAARGRAPGARNAP